MRQLQASVEGAIPESDVSPRVLLLVLDGGAAEEARVSSVWRARRLAGNKEESNQVPVIRLRMCRDLSHALE